jgi:sec-independent protein translocase protein TatA
MPSIGPLEIVVLILILLVIFGPKRIPELGRSIGQGMRNFKESVTGRDRKEERGELEAPSASAGTDRSADTRPGEPTRSPGGDGSERPRSEATRPPRP